MDNKRLKNIIWIVLPLALILVSGCTIPKIRINWPDFPKPEYHAHADIRVMLDWNVFDFNKAVYMSTPSHPLNENVHMHDFNPHVIHLESTTATLGDFFRSIGMSIDSRCLDTGKGKYCSNGAENLLVYVNGLPLLLNYDSYIPADLDKILVYYGKGVPTQKMLQGVTNEACIYSKKCIPPLGFHIEEEPCEAGKPCTLP